ncbi:MAG: polynucleotide adenylyltransferase PcnB [Kangiellaceae bacterium]|nr:polynucleotide adenylyltransferase PcnB [Kangiellaceae bacterium]
MSPRINSFIANVKNSAKSWLAGDKSSVTTAEQHIVSRDQHSISRKDISDNALKVLYRLKKGGYEAFLVGGGVRDILLGLHPKDFDIATNATPEQCRKLFRNCRIVGRRFKLAHILFGRDVIEVATFRAHCDDNIEQGQEGMILRDNVYGSIEEDAIRRDFTINALYYNINDFSVHDYCGGLTDLRKRQLRMIGDPETRYREDPVRMLRAVRLETKLDLTIEKNTLRPIDELSNLLKQVPAARLWEEYRKMFLSGHGLKTFAALREHGLFHALFPATDRALIQDNSDSILALIEHALINTDNRIREEQSVNPAFLIAVLLWQPLLDHAESMQRKGVNFNDAFFKSMGKVLASQSEHISIPRRYSLVIRDIWALQLRLPMNYGKKAYQVLEHPRFRAAYDFLVLRSQAEEKHQELAQWWTEFQDMSPEKRRTVLRNNHKNSGPKRRYRSKKRKTTPQTHSQN